MAETPENIPEASFSSHVYTIGIQALIFLGKQPHPETGEYVRNLDVAKFQIDTLEILTKKTEGNRTDEESKLLEDLLHAVRLAYIDERKRDEAEGEAKA